MENGDAYYKALQSTDKAKGKRVAGEDFPEKALPKKGPLVRATQSQDHSNSTGMDRPGQGEEKAAGSSLVQSVGELELYLQEQGREFLQDLAIGQAYQGQVYISHKSLRSKYVMQRLLDE